MGESIGCEAGARCARVKYRSGQRYARVLWEDRPW
jgi:hypothetical protein